MISNQRKYMFGNVYFNQSPRECTVLILSMNQTTQSDLDERIIVMNFCKFKIEFASSAITAIKGS